MEEQLLKDLLWYGVTKNNLRFDWSDSCIEGKDASYLDGALENYSGISIIDKQNKTVADGWMNFILADDYFLVFWDFLTSYHNGEQVHNKKSPGIPTHIWDKIPEDIRGLYKNDRMKSIVNPLS